MLFLKVPEYSANLFVKASLPSGFYLKPNVCVGFPRYSFENLPEKV